MTGILGYVRARAARAKGKHLYGSRSIRIVLLRR